MTVKELIAILMQMPEDREVGIRGMYVPDGKRVTKKNLVPTYIMDVQRVEDGLVSTYSESEDDLFLESESVIIHASESTID